MKRGLSFIIALTMMTTSAAALFSGCSDSEAAGKMIVSEWLYLINQKFGFSEYTESEPYIANITSENESFDDVQIAFEYSVLPEGYTALDLDSELSREFCALTLAGAVYIPNNAELNISDHDKLMFPESVATVVNEGIMELDGSGNFNPGENVAYDYAVEALERAYYSWTHHTFERKLSYELADNVVDFAGLSTVDLSGSSYAVSDEYVSEQKNWLNNNNFFYDHENGIVTVDNISEKNIAEGSILAVPGSVEYPEGIYLKVDSIEEADGKYRLEVSEPELEEIFPNGFVYQGTDTANFNKAVVYDGDGNLISAGFLSNNDNIAAPMAYDPANMRNDDDSDVITVPLKIGNSSANLKLKMAVGSIDASFEYKLGESQTSSLYFGKTFSNFTLVSNLNANPFEYMKVGMNFKATDKISFKHKFYDYSGKSKAASSGDVLDQSELMGILMDAFAEHTGDDVTVNPTLAKIKLPVAPGVFVDMTLKLRFSIDGAIDLTITYANQEIGIEKRKWSVFPLKTPAPTAYFDIGTKTSSSISGSIKAECTLGLNFAATIACVNIIDIEPAVGLGAKLSGAVNYVNESRQPLIDGIPLIPLADYIMTDLGVTLADNCLELSEAVEGDNDNIVSDLSSGNTQGFLLCADLTVYPIARLTGATKDSLVGKYITSISRDFLDDKSSSIIKGHFERDSSGFHATDCTLADRIDDGIERGDHIEITPMADVMLDVDDEALYRITMLPETNKKIYTLSDITIEAVDAETGEKTSIVTVDAEFTKNSNGITLKKLLESLGFSKPKETDEENKGEFKITALSSGDALIKIKTRDGLFEAGPINVHVNSPEETSSPTINLMTYSASVALGNSITLSASYIPSGKDETSVFWECDNEAIAAINPISGEISGISEGYCTVKAYIPGYEDSCVYCLITVTEDYTSTNISENYSGNLKSWIKVDGLPVMIIEKT